MQARILVADNGCAVLIGRRAMVYRDVDEMLTDLRDWWQRGTMPPARPFHAVGIQQAENGFLLTAGRRMRVCTTWQEVEACLKQVL